MDRTMRTVALVAALAALIPAAACAKGGGQNDGQQAVAAGNGGMTLTQFEARRGGRLMAADSDGDGRVSRAEFLGAAQGKGGHDHGDPGSRFDRLDANHDGMLDKGEIDAMLRRRFQRMDANGDGVVTRAERMAMHQGGGQEPASDGNAADAQD